MNFKNLNLDIKYRSSENDIVKEFYIPVLSRATLYKRAVGFFSSTALLEVSKGVSGLVKNGGKIQIVASPKLHEKDIEAINIGYEERNKIIEQAILRSIYQPANRFEEERLNILAHLIADNILNIKLAYFENKKKIGIYHEKIGLIYDQNNNKIAFTGSLNESTTAFIENFESIDVFCSWKGNESLERVQDKEKDFDMLWNNKTVTITVTDFPLVAKEKIFSYKKSKVQYDIDKKQFLIQERKEQILKKIFPKIPDNIELYDYQLEAVNNWIENNSKGIFNMATGTGKTYTGLAAIAKLFKKNGRLAVIIVCPYQHLVEQWVKDILRFNMNPIIGYSASLQKNWKKRLENAAIDFSLNIIDHFCLVTTNATYASGFVQKQLRQINGDIVLVVDEAHNFGATKLSKKLNFSIPYRLALSATIERHRDPEGTNKLFSYFEKECIHYSLERAIKEKKLTPYYYYPVKIYLTDEELEGYQKLSIEIGKCVKTKSDGSTVLNDRGKRLAIRRARLVAGASNKIGLLLDKMIEYKNESHILVYCGATTVSDIDYIEGQADLNELRQITVVGDLLGNRLNMKVSQFTSQENSYEREVLKKEFEEGDNLQVLIAIRCLDEGVNIPKIKTAFILASSTNPKEYIQRRGRVLRLAEGKNSAVIYDFITLPRSLEIVKNFPLDIIKYDYSLIEKEIARMEDFAKLSLNPHDSDKLINRIKDVYDDIDNYYGGELNGN